MKLTIWGAPRTKKTSNQAVLMPSQGKGQPCPHCGKPVLAKVFPSAAWRDWVKAALIWAHGGRRFHRVKIGKEKVTLVSADAGVGVRWRAVAEPVNCRAVFYRDANRGDLLGYQQGLADLLQEWEILADDLWIQGWDGSRLAVDRAQPRVELELTPLQPSLMDGAQDQTDQEVDAKDPGHLAVRLRP